MTAPADDNTNDTDTNPSPNDSHQLAANVRYALVKNADGQMALADYDGNELPLDGPEDALSAIRLLTTQVEGHTVVDEAALDDQSTAVDDRWTTDYDGEMAQVTFYPQVWSGEHAKTGDPIEYEVPLPDATDDEGELLPDQHAESDRLKDHPNAPPAVRNHTGPFFVNVDAE